MSDESAIAALIAEIEAKLQHFQAEFEDLSWRGKVLLLVEVSDGVSSLGVRSNPAAANVAARDRLRLYLIQHVGIIIDSRELRVVSGISEYGRRVRELRVEDGFKILTQNSNDPELGVCLSPSEYLLLDPAPDLRAARRWRIANRIRRETSGGSRARLLAYLKENVGEVVTTEELAYVGKVSQFGRRVRELRSEEGFAIATKFTGRPDLRMGEYVLENLTRIAERHDRKIPFDVAKTVYERAGNACQLCGWDQRKWSRKDPRILELHHVAGHASGGANSPSNLVVLCSRCHDGIHAGRLAIPPDILA